MYEYTWLAESIIFVQVCRVGYTGSRFWDSIGNSVYRESEIVLSEFMY